MISDNDNMISISDTSPGVDLFILLLSNSVAKANLNTCKITGQALSYTKLNTDLPEMISQRTMHLYLPRQASTHYPKLRSRKLKMQREVFTVTPES